MSKRYQAVVELPSDGTMHLYSRLFRSKEEMKEKIDKDTDYVLVGYVAVEHFDWWNE